MRKIFPEITSFCLYSAISFLLMATFKAFTDINLSHIVVIKLFSMFLIGFLISLFRNIIKDIYKAR